MVYLSEGPSDDDSNENETGESRMWHVKRASARLDQEGDILVGGMRAVPIGRGNYDSASLDARPRPHRTRKHLADLRRKPAERAFLERVQALKDTPYIDQTDVQRRFLSGYEALVELRVDVIYDCLTGADLISLGLPLKSERGSEEDMRKRLEFARRLKANGGGLRTLKRMNEVINLALQDRHEESNQAIRGSRRWYFLSMQRLGEQYCQETDPINRGLLKDAMMALINSQARGYSDAEVDRILVRAGILTQGEVNSFSLDRTRAHTSAQAALTAARAFRDAARKGEEPEVDSMWEATLQGLEGNGLVREYPEYPEWLDGEDLGPSEERAWELQRVAQRAAKSRNTERALNRQLRSWFITDED